MANRIKQCVFCGKKTKTTKDHIPPKAIFPKPLPNKLITVPACKTCNGGSSNDDELFSFFLALKAGMNGKCNRSLHDKIKRSVQQNKRLQRHLKQSIPVVLQDDNNVKFVEFYLTKVDSTVLNDTIKKTVLGLFYYHFNEIIFDKIDISIKITEGVLDDYIIDLLQYCEDRSIGNNNEVVYRFGRAQDHNLASVWVITLYESLEFSCITTPKNIK